MATIVENALLIDLDPIGVEHGALRLEGGLIVERGSSVRVDPGDERVDGRGAVVLPGLVNGHTHLYSALAVGMPPPARAPRDFLEILRFVWWRLDRALDAESIEASALIGALDALHCGTTTLIDHHASPSFIDGSLEVLERGIARVGLRAVLCYETTDRNGRAGRDAGLTENERYLKRLTHYRDGRFAALVGAHASFTLNDDSLDALASLADAFSTGVHLHVAEDPCDEQACLREHAAGLIERLERHHVLRAGTVLAHGTHLDAAGLARLTDRGVTLAHNPRSNMNNAVGYTPVGLVRCPVMLGTDGLGSDLFTEARFAWFKSRDARAGIGPNAVVAMLAASARRASESLGVTLGRLTVGAAADVVMTDYTPATPLTADNLAGHLLFGLSAHHVRHVLIAGEWRLRAGEVAGMDEHGERSKARAISQALWKRMATLT